VAIVTTKRKNSLKDKLDAIDYETKEAVFNGFFTSRMGILMGQWEKGEAIEENVKNRGVNFTYYQLEKETGRPRPSLKQWHEIYLKNPDKESYKLIAEEKSKAWTIKALKSSENKDWYQLSESPEWPTPQWLFDLLDDEFGFELDVCATKDNAKCKKYYTKKQDGLNKKWNGCCWMNPPYGREIADWMAKAKKSAEKGAKVVCLVPARPDTDWWWENALSGEIRFIRGRLKWPGSNTIAPFPSAVVVLGKDAVPGKVIWWEISESN